jgi:hypothetical protein
LLSDKKNKNNNNNNNNNNNKGGEEQKEQKEEEEEEEGRRSQSMRSNAYSSLRSYLTDPVSSSSSASFYVSRQRKLESLSDSELASSSSSVSSPSLIAQMKKTLAEPLPGRDPETGLQHHHPLLDHQCVTWRFYASHSSEVGWGGRGTTDDYFVSLWFVFCARSFVFCLCLVLSPCSCFVLVTVLGFSSSSSSSLSSLIVLHCFLFCLSGFFFSSSSFTGPMGAVLFGRAISKKEVAPTRAKQVCLSASLSFFHFILVCPFSSSL